MLSPLFTEVKLRKGVGQAFPGVNPSGGAAFMYQMQQAPAPAPLQPAPAVAAPAPPMPTVAVPAGSTPALPPSPAPAEVSPKYVAEAIALVAFLGALLIPSSH